MSNNRKLLARRRRLTLNGYCA